MKYILFLSILLILPFFCSAQYQTKSQVKASIDAAVKILNTANTNQDTKTKKMIADTSAKLNLKIKVLTDSLSILKKYINDNSAIPHPSDFYYENKNSLRIKRP